MKQYNGVTYRVVTDLNKNGCEVFCIDYRRWFLFIPYWTRWISRSGGLFIESVSKLEYSSADKAEAEFKKQIDKVNKKKNFKSKEVV